MILSSSSFLRLFDLLVEKISSDLFPNSEKKPTLKEISYATINIETKNEKDTKGTLVKKVNFSKYKLHSPFAYFINLRTSANKGLDISLNDIKFAKAIEYIEELPDLQFYSGEIFQQEINKLKLEFEEKYKTDLSTVAKEDITEATLLNILAKREDLLELKSITGIASKFLRYISEKKYFDAWELLSPDLRENSLWNGQITLFKAFFEFINSIETDNIWSSISCSFQKVSFSTYIFFEVTLFDPDEVRKKINNLDSIYLYPFSKRQNVMLRKTIEQDRWKMRYKNYHLVLPFLEVYENLFTIGDLSTLTYQQHFLISYIELQARLKSNNSLPIASSKKIILEDIYDKYTKRVREYYRWDLSITCEYINDKWRIDRLVIKSENRNPVRGILASFPEK